jgi:hypothetical protein
VVVPEAERHHALEGGEGPATITDFEKGFSETGEGVLVVGVPRHRAIEAAPRPGVLFAREVGVGHPHMQFDRVRIERHSDAEEIQCFVVPAFVIEGMGVLVVFVGA